MSRHLMAKMRSAARPVQWQAGAPRGYAGSTPAWNDPADHHSAIVHHGEERFALEVKPSRSTPRDPQRGWTWGIFRRSTNPMVGQPGYEGEHHRWSYMSDQFPDSPAMYVGHTVEHGYPRVKGVVHVDDPLDLETAKRLAEENWARHIKYVNSINPLFADDPGGGRPADPEGGWDIFGDQ